MNESLRSPLLHVSFAFGLLVVGGCEENVKIPADGGSCSVVSAGAHPHSDPGTATCVACTSNEHCASPTPTCDPGTHACVGCGSNEQCPDVAAPVCNAATGACGGCTADAECARFAATPVCEEASGKCVACTADTEAARCGVKSCSRSTFACTETTRGSVRRCGACQGDSECKVDDSCVPLIGTNSELLGTYCLPRSDQGACGSTTTNPLLLPYVRPITTATVDGANVTVCATDLAISCEAMVAAGHECGLSGAQAAEVSASCSRVGWNDGVCAKLSPSGAPVCFHICKNDRDCSSLETCDATATTPTFCQ